MDESKWDEFVKRAENWARRRMLAHEAAEQGLTQQELLDELVRKANIPDAPPEDWG